MSSVMDLDKAEIDETGSVSENGIIKTVGRECALFLNVPLPHSDKGTKCKETAVSRMLLDAP